MVIILDDSKENSCEDFDKLEEIVVKARQNKIKKNKEKVENTNENQNFSDGTGNSVFYNFVFRH